MDTVPLNYRFCIVLNDKVKELSFFIEASLLRMDIGGQVSLWSSWLATDGSTYHLEPGQIKQLVTDDLEIILPNGGQPSKKNKQENGAHRNHIDVVFT